MKKMKIPKKKNFLEKKGKWKEIINFATINKGGISINKILKII